MYFLAGKYFALGLDGFFRNQINPSMITKQATALIPSNASFPV